MTILFDKGGGLLKDKGKPCPLVLATAPCQGQSVRGPLPAASRHLFPSKQSKSYLVARQLLCCYCLAYGIV